MDKRVIDKPYWLRTLLVKAVIVPFRYKNSARCYSTIWTPDGSPLMVHSKKLVEKLQETMQVKVAIGLSYSFPSIEEATSELKGCQQIIVLPLFPQYASATSGSCIQEVMRCLSKWQVIPELSIVGPFAEDERFIDAWVENAKSIDIDAYDHVLFSFHGLPVSQVQKADTFSYPDQCVSTAEAIAKRLNITRYTICYQSRLGREEWLTPYTAGVIKERANLGDKRLLVFAPSFVADCLETLYEIGIEYREEFQALGGEALDLVPSLNTHPAWIKAVVGLFS